MGICVRIDYSVADSFQEKPRCSIGHVQIALSSPVDARSFTLHYSCSLSCANEYLAIDSGGCLCTKRFPALIAPW